MTDWASKSSNTSGSSMSAVGVNWRMMGGEASAAAGGFFVSVLGEAFFFCGDGNED